MNNRYTCKAKRKDNGEWIYGDYYSKNNIHHIIEINNSDPFINIHKDINVIIPETLCQCTGLQDIEGNYIFENDIVNNNNLLENVNYEVIFKNGAFYGERKNYYFPEETVYLKLFQTNLKDIKIIGNKFDEVVK